MPNKPPLPQKQNSNRDLLRYAGMATQIFVALGLAVFIGLKIDKALDLSYPVVVWVLPLLVIVAIIWQIIRETNKKNNQ